MSVRHRRSFDDRARCGRDDKPSTFMSAVTWNHSYNAGRYNPPRLVPKVDFVRRNDNSLIRMVDFVINTRPNGRKGLRPELNWADCWSVGEYCPYRMYVCGYLYSADARCGMRLGFATRLLLSQKDDNVPKSVNVLLLQRTSRQTIRTSMFRL